MTAGDREGALDRLLGSWPRLADGEPVLPGDAVRLPGCGTVVFVTQVSFSRETEGARVNGFWVGRGERAEAVGKGCMHRVR